MSKPFTPIATRFWRMVSRGAPNECWPWLGSFRRDGYGQFNLGGRFGRIVGAHRVAFELGHGPVPVGMLVLHACDNRACVNPAHLRAGTQQDNMDDAGDRGRRALGFRLPHTKLSEDDVRAIRHSTLGFAELATKYGVNPSTITRVRAGQRRATVTTPELNAGGG